MRSLSFSAVFLATAWAAAPILGAGLQKPSPEDDDDTPLPVVIWHGLGDSYTGDGIKRTGELAEAINPGTLVYNIFVEEGGSQDSMASYQGNVTEQIAKVCDQLAAHPILSTAPAIDAIGFSQGGLFLRGYIERCNSPPIRSLVTFGSPHNGFVTIKACNDNNLFCRGLMGALTRNPWFDWVQRTIVPAQYFRDPADYDRYLEKSNFLADINNERKVKNATYAANLATLTNLVLYMFDSDETLVPKESSWFEEVNGTEATPLRARKIYNEDWLGLREIDRRGGLVFKTIPGKHMQWDDATMNATIRDYFGPFGRKFDHSPASVIDEL